MGSIDIVYVLGKGSKWYNNEIRYSIRSVVKHCADFRNIFIVGEWPDFLQPGDGLIHIPASDKFSKEANIWNKVLAACVDPLVSDDFLFINDDHFMLKPFSAVHYPFYCKGDLSDRGLSGNDAYTYVLKASYHCMVRNGLPTWHFDIHTPIVFNKEKFRKTFERFEKDIHSGQGIVMKSAYCNFNGIAPVMLQDMKLRRGYSHLELLSKIGNRHVISVGDEALTENFRRWLNVCFPEVSRWER